MSQLTRDDVISAYEMLLGRPPESDAAIESHLAHPSVGALLRYFTDSAEYRAKQKSSPFFYYNSELDLAEILRRHENPDRTAKTGHVVNFMNVAMNVSFMPFLADHAGRVEDLPIPANWHADMAEFAAALRAVDLARGRFAMIELGCGWGCWMNNTGVAAKRRGLPVHVIGVEGDEGHIAFAHEALATNGFEPHEYTLHRGIAGARPGVALFPKQERAGEAWGLEAMFDVSPDVRAKKLATGNYDELPIQGLETLIGDRKKIDLLHIDIQGAEADFVHGCLPILRDRVGYIVIGTHSRQIEGRLMSDLLPAGWILEIERPAILAMSGSGPVVTVDGVQGWRNPSLTRI